MLVLLGTLVASATSASVNILVKTTPESTELPVPPNFVGFSTEEEPLGYLAVFSLHTAFIDVQQRLNALHMGIDVWQ